ncbi:MAG TPA: hypothetical protein VGD37_34205 [Kofleriaceae bacterium]|jgi:hypothetical protein
MSPNRWKAYVVPVIACAALALSIHALRAPGPSVAAGTERCVDQDAREQIDRLRRALADRDALVARLARAASTQGGQGSAGATIEAPPPSMPAAEPAEPAPRRFVRFESPNPAVNVTQKADGSYDIRTTDPALAGTVVQITAVTAAGEEEKVLIRIP